jgi:hypothetical protein
MCGEFTWSDAVLLIIIEEIAINMRSMPVKYQDLISARPRGRIESVEVFNVI